MLEQYFLKPSTIDRLRGSWIATEIEAYVAWLVDQGYSARSIFCRVPIGFAFGEFARERGARTIGDLPAYVDAFVAARVAAHDAAYSSRPMAKEVRGPVEQMLSVVVAGFEPTGRPHHRQPFVDVAPGFFEYLAEERGLRPASAVSYHHYLCVFEEYLRRIGVNRLARWYREDVAPQARLYKLSTFMGHVDPTSTAIYLTITPQLLAEANHRFEALAEPAWTEDKA
jgi:hypothetical protein